MSIRRRGRRRGQSVLYAVLLMPMLLSLFALAIDIGALQLERLRLHYALDLATVTAAGSVDLAAYQRTGRLRLDSSEATAVARDYLLRNLTVMPDTPQPQQITAQAEIVIVNRVPALDPFTGTTIDRPSVCARIRVAHRFALLGLVGMPGGTITITSEAEVRS